MINLTVRLAEKFYLGSKLRCMRIMAVTLAIYMFLGSLFPQTDFSQLPKSVFAIQHFQQHLQEERASGEFESPWNFAVKHFFNLQDHAPGHEHEHSQLPYQSVNSIGAFTLANASFFPPLNLLVISSDILLQDQAIPKIDVYDSIFRPPIC